MFSRLPLRSSRASALLAFSALALILLATNCLAQSAPASGWNRDSLITAARELMNAAHYCALITVDSLGRPNARTINPFHPEDDMTVWMATSNVSRKAAEIRKNPQVCLYYADHTNATGMVALHGKAVLVDDKAEIKKRYRAYWDQAFPGGKNLVLIKVVPQRLEVVNYAHHLNNEPVTFAMPAVDFPAH